MIVDFKIKESEFIFNGETINSIVYNTDYTDGIHIDLFTGLDVNNDIQQVRVIKDVTNGTMNITIRYSTGEEINEYIYNINNPIE